MDMVLLVYVSFVLENKFTDLRAAARLHDLGPASWDVCDWYRNNQSRSNDLEIHSNSQPIIHMQTHGEARQGTASRKMPSRR